MGICTKASGETTRCAVVVNLLPLIMGLLIPVLSRTIASMAKGGNSGGTSWASTTAAAWASSIKEGASVAMKVVIRMICLMAEVTLFVLMEEAMKENGVKGKDVGLEDKYYVRLSSGGMLPDVISGQQRVVSSTEVRRWLVK